MREIICIELHLYKMTVMLYIVFLSFRHISAALFSITTICPVASALSHPLAVQIDLVTSTTSSDMLVVSWVSILYRACSASIMFESNNSFGFV